MVAAVSPSPRVPIPLATLYRRVSFRSQSVHRVRFRWPRSRNALHDLCARWTVSMRDLEASQNADILLDADLRAPPPRALPVAHTYPDPQRLTARPDPSTAPE